jgi:rhodanese-related sulfurtransferase
MKWWEMGWLDHNHARNWRAVVVYCEGGDCQDSRQAAYLLVRYGYRNISIFPGGWETWSANGLPGKIVRQVSGQ